MTTVLVVAVGLAACSSHSASSATSTTATTAPRTSSSGLVVHPDSGLVNMQSVDVTGSGFTASSPGNVLQCNGDPNQPTVSLPAPIGTRVPVGCSAPSLTALASTSSSGALSTTYKVVVGTVGPPCGTTSALVQCPATDSAGSSPASDAAAYPCPPTPAQQSAGVVCVLTFGDESGNTASAPITFKGQKT